MTITIPLNLLQISPLNARKTPPRATEQAELAASIVAHGLLENLIVCPTDTEHYDVLAGGRRLMAMQNLVSEGRLEADHPVACLVHDGDQQEVSLAENVVRLSMHALDQFEAFAALADQGLSVADISARFGCTDTLVRQRLRLGRIAPETRLQDRLEAYDEAMANGEDTPEDEDKITGLEEEYEALEHSLLVYAPEDVSRSGCMITVNHDGSLNVRRGLVLPEDQITEADSPTDKPGTYSARLLEDLGHTRLEIAQKHLAQDVDCAYDVMLFTLAHAVLETGSLCDRPLDICFTTTLPHNWSEESDTTGAELSPEIDMGWLDLAPAAGFAALSSLPMADKQRLFAYCTALTLRGRLADDDLHEAIGCRLGIDMAAHWRPTANNFFKRVTRPRALEIAADVLGAQWAKNHAGEKKAVLADTLEANFAGNRTPGVTAEQAAAAARWLPDGMAYPVNHEVAEVAAIETDLPEAFDLPAAV